MRARMLKRRTREEQVGTLHWSKEAKVPALFVAHCVEKQCVISQLWEKIDLDKAEKTELTLTLERTNFLISHCAFPIFCL